MLMISDLCEQNPDLEGISSNILKTLFFDCPPIVTLYNFFKPEILQWQKGSFLLVVQGV